jgi:nucleoside-diphosphate-sugar epimerase
MMMRVFITGIAGLVGQNLVANIKKMGTFEICGVDKHAHNLAVLRRLHPEITLLDADCAEAGTWETELGRCDALVILHAQIGGLFEEDFIRNNIDATQRVLNAAQRGRVSYIVHVSSSVVNSAACDFYTETKKAQEALVRGCALPHATLRPTLMFGWFDRKHLGWLKRFLERAPLFPIPGSGRYLRQPLFAGDFCAIIAACLMKKVEGTFNITGLERIYFIDLIREVRGVAGVRTPVVRIPYTLFWTMLAAYARIDRNPPFTTQQLKALVTPDVFEVIDWPGIFRVTPTPLRAALEQTFNDPDYAHVTLRF